MATTKPDRIPLQDFLDGIAIEEEIARLSLLTYEQIAEELKAEGIDPERARAALMRALDRSDGSGGPGPAPRERRRLRVIPIVLAVAAAIAVIAGAVEREEIQAWLSPAKAPAPRHLVPQTPDATPKDEAGRLREAAGIDVKKGYYGDALDELDEAMALDPAGEGAGTVVKLRVTIDEFRHQTTVYGGFAKPSVGPGERPLQRSR